MRSSTEWRSRSLGNSCGEQQGGQRHYVLQEVEELHFLKKKKIAGELCDNSTSNGLECSHSHFPKKTRMGRPLNKNA